MPNPDQHLIVAPPSSTRIVSLLALSVGLCAVGASQLEFAKKEYVEGFVQPRGGELRVVAPAAGSVRYVVDVGDSVQAGQTVAFVENSEILSSGKSPQENQMKVLTERQTSLQTELGALQDGVLARRAALTAQLHLLESALAQAKQEADTRRQFLDLERRKVERHRTLREKGFLSAPAVEEAEAFLLERQAQVHVAERSASEAASSLAAVRAELANLATQAKSQQQQLGREMLGVQEASTRSEMAAALGVMSPRAAEVVARATSPGDTAQQGQLLLRLSPANAPQEAVLLLPATAAGRVKPGQAVTLQMAAYPYQTYGLVEAVVSHVDKSALVAQDAQVLAGSGLVPGAVVVRASARISKVPSPIGTLKSGMQFRAAVEVERKSFLAWMVAPILKNFQ